MAAPIITQRQERIRTARETGRRLEQVTAEQYWAERETDPEMAEITKITDVIDFLLGSHGH